MATFIGKVKIKRCNVWSDANQWIFRVHSSLSDTTEVRDDLFIREDVALRYGLNTDKKDEL